MAKYQKEYAAGRPQMYDVASRQLRAKRMVLALADHFGKTKIKKLTVLDVGSSTGIIDHHLARHFGNVVGIDIDEGAVKFAAQKFKQRNLTFRVADAMQLKMGINKYDVVICAQIYEHVPDPHRLMTEIYKVLKPGGVCYFAALNKWWPWEPHYNLPFLSWLPKSLANKYLKLVRGKDTYYETLLSYPQLVHLVEKFTVIDYTTRILENPQKYGYNQTLPKMFRPLARLIAPVAKYVTPTVFWLLEK